MNTRFTIEEENIVAIYAEDSRETTLENILAAMPYMDEDMRQLAAAAVNKLQAMTDSEFSEREFILTDERSGEQAASHDGQRVFRKGVYLDRRVIAHSTQGRGCRLPAPRPCSFFALAWTIRKPFFEV